MKLLYDFSILLFHIAIRIAAFSGNTKAKNWLSGRKNIFTQIEKRLQPDERRIWFHCASLGEFEQGRTVMEKFKMQNAECKIVLTFFSPSGYEIRKNYIGADYVFYLPLDTNSNVEKFISLVNPEKVFFIKYEFWFHYLDTLQKKNIPTYLVSAIFRPQQKFFKWYGGFFRSMLESFDHLFLQDEASALLLDSIRINNYSIAGDTRFDRVVELASQVKPVPLVEKFKDGKKLFIAGSSWEADEQLVHSLFSVITKQPLSFKLIVAPHEISEGRINGLLKKFSEFRIERISSVNANDISLAQVLIIDNIGMLSSLYQYGTYGFIGGGFGKGIHNTLEAAVFGIPVFFGPNYQKFREAKELVNCGGAFSVRTVNELNFAFMNLENDNANWEKASMAARNYVSSKKGATEKIIAFLNTR